MKAPKGYRKTRNTLWTLYKTYGGKLLFGYFVGTVEQNTCTYDSTCGYDVERVYLPAFQLHNGPIVAMHGNPRSDFFVEVERIGDDDRIVFGKYSNNTNELDRGIEKDPEWDEDISADLPEVEWAD